jgi:site-specific DNA-adenine methylase
MTPAHKVMDYYGGKYRLARYYPAPVHDVIVEPFCGGAGYSLHHYNKQVHLYDLNPKVVGVWDYVIKADPDEIRALPLLEPEQRVSDLQVHQEAKWLIRWWIQYASADAYHTVTAKIREKILNNSSSAWTHRRREYIAQTSALIKHWRVTCASYQDIPNTRATWFIDPPYQCKAGRKYPFNKIDFEHLAEWSRSREGQVMVCENSDSEAWLPFQPFRECVGASKTGGEAKKTQEVVWYSETQEPVQGELF